MAEFVISAKYGLTKDFLLKSCAGELEFVRYVGRCHAWLHANILAFMTSVMFSSKKFFYRLHVYYLNNNF